MEIVKVDNVVYLAGDLNGQELSDAMEIGNNINQEVSMEYFKRYLMRDNVGELLDMNIGTHNAVSTRDLREEETLKLTMAQGQFQIAKAKAIKSLENDFFEANF